MDKTAEAFFKLWSPWKAGVGIEDDPKPDGSLLRQFVSTAAAAQGRTSPHREPIDPLAEQFLRQHRARSLAARLSNLCEQREDGLYAVYQGIRGYAAEAMRGSLSLLGGIVISGLRPWSCAPTAASALTHARRVRKRIPITNSLVYRAWVSLNDVVYVEDPKDGFDVARLDAEQEIVVWHASHYTVCPDDVVNANVKPAAPTAA